MPELNKANRQVCDVDIRILKTRYQSTVDTISNYERYFLIKGKVK